MAMGVAADAADSTRIAWTIKQFFHPEARCIAQLETLALVVDLLYASVCMGAPLPCARFGFLFLKEWRCSFSGTNVNLLMTKPNLEHGIAVHTVQGCAKKVGARLREEFSRLQPAQAGQLVLNKTVTFFRTTLQIG